MENFSQQPPEQAACHSLQSKTSLLCYDFNHYIRTRFPAALAGNSMDPIWRRLEIIKLNFV